LSECSGHIEQSVWSDTAPGCGRRAFPNDHSPPRCHPRRLAAILAADVVGFSSMMEKDEGGTLSRI
jgi:class 3 adenylate cyclase